MGPAQGTQQREKEHEEEQEQMLVHEEFLLAWNEEKGQSPAEKEGYGASWGKVKRLGEKFEFSTNNGSTAPAAEAASFSYRWAGKTVRKNVTIPIWYNSPTFMSKAVYIALIHEDDDYWTHDTPLFVGSFPYCRHEALVTLEEEKGRKDYHF
jgi:hypothetical protein